MKNCNCELPIIRGIEPEEYCLKCEKPLTMKKERPILFSTPMIQAILRGEKTQTRRVVKSRHESGLFQICRNKQGVVTAINSLDWDERNCEKDIICPYGKVGDVLWVRETWQHTKCLNINPEDENYGYVFRADGQPWNDYEGWTWKPSIFMPRKACRIKLEITGIRVERINEISDYDALCEGIPVELPVAGLDVDIDGGWWPNRAKEHYKRLWEHINGKGTFGNQWVWVIEFKRIDNEHLL